MGELQQNRSANPDPLDAARHRSATLALRGCRRWCAPFRRLQRLPLPRSAAKVKLPLWRIGEALRSTVWCLVRRTGQRRASARMRWQMRYGWIVAMLTACAADCPGNPALTCRQERQQCEQQDKPYCEMVEQACVQVVYVNCMQQMQECFDAAEQIPGKAGDDAWKACHVKQDQCIRTAADSEVQP